MYEWVIVIIAMNWKDKVAIVTGGNSGIGKAIVDSLAGQGLRLILAGRREKENRAAAEEIASRHSATVLPHTADVSREEDCLRLIQAAKERFGRLDLLINNAGKGGSGKITETTSDFFDSVLRTNLYSAYWCSREAYRLMQENEPETDEDVRGAILNISSICGVEAWAGIGVYAASKHGMLGLTRAMADEGADDRIRVAAVCPALVATDMTGASGPEVIAPKDIAATINYLLQLKSAAWPTEIVVRRRSAD